MSVLKEKFQTRGADGKYQKYTLTVRILRDIIRLCKKKKKKQSYRVRS